MTEIEVIQALLKHFGYSSHMSPKDFEGMFLANGGVSPNLGIPDPKNPIINGIDRRQKKLKLTINDHIRAIVYSLLSNQRKWDPIQANMSYIDGLFENFDANKLKNINPDILVKGLLSKNLGNRNIRRQMNHLKDNICYIESLDSNPGGIDSYYDNFIAKNGVCNLVKQLTNNLDNFGISLVCEYLKGVGVDVCKPDTHIVRFVSNAYIGWEPAIKWYSGYVASNKDKYMTINCIERISKKTGYSCALIDILVWNFCKDGTGICHSSPASSLCIYKLQGQCPIKSGCMHK